MTPLTIEDLASINKFLEDGDLQFLSTPSYGRLQDTCKAVNEKVATAARMLYGQNGRLIRRLDNARLQREAQADAGVFPDLNIDSVIIARALIYCLKEVGAYELSMAKVMCLMYEVYAVWLAEHSQRVCLERPVAQVSGPWFWRVRNNLPKYMANVLVTADDWKALTQLNPGVAVLVRNVASKYSSYPEQTLTRYLTGTQPYLSCTKEKNGGKWNKEFSDSQIFHWKRGQTING